MDRLVDTKKKRRKIVKIVLIVLGAIIATALFLTAYYFLNQYVNYIPEWLPQVEELGMQYISENEDIVAEHGEDCVIRYSRMSYNKETLRCNLYYYVDGIAYVVYIEPVDGEFSPVGYERVSVEEALFQ